MQPDPHACRCNPAEGWPVLYVHHRGDAYYRAETRHDPAHCGLPPEPVTTPPITIKWR